MAASKVTYENRISAVVARLNPEVVQAVTATAEAVKARAKATVRVDEGDLRNSIETTGAGLRQGVEAGTDHAWPQELGRPDLPQYGYTPYMKPSAEAERQRHTDRVADAVARATRG